jgi:hypothetical protein
MLPESIMLVFNFSFKYPPYCKETESLNIEVLKRIWPLMTCSISFIIRNHIINHSSFPTSVNSQAVSLTTLKQSEAVPSTLKPLRSTRGHVTETRRIQNINTHSSNDIRMQLTRDFWKWQRQLDNLFFSVRIPGSDAFYGFILFNLTSLWIFKRKEKGRNKYELSSFIVASTLLWKEK